MTTQILEIQSGIALPRGDLGSYRRYPWNALGVGDSFFAPGRDVRTISSSAGQAARRLHTRYTCRTVVEDGVRGVRVWRAE